MKYKLTLLPALVAILSLLAILASADASQTKTHFAPDQKLALKDPTPEKPSDFTLDFNLPSGDVQFAGIVYFIPDEWGIVKGDAIPVGASVGTVKAQATLGLFGGACNTSLPVTFDMLNGAINTKDTVSFNDTDESGTPDYAKDTNKTGLQDGIKKYPDWDNRIFKNQQPIRRSVGITIVAGIPVILQFLIFPPGSQLDVNIPSDPALGYPTVTVLQNLGDPGVTPTPGTITSFCTPLTSKNTVFGATPEGKAVFLNPKPGKYDFTTLAVGQRDADGDGIENTLDTCPFTPNVGDPRIPYSGNVSGDGMDAACDPDAQNPSPNSDRDGDGYLNHGDNCPLIANGEEQAKVPNVGNQTDADLDQIGDACDPHPNTPDGELSKVTLKTTMTIGDGTGTGGRPSNCTDCYDPTQPTNPPSQGNGSSGGGGGSSSTTIIIIIVAVVAAVVVLGGGGFYFMRRRGGGGGGAA